MRISSTAGAVCQRSARRVRKNFSCTISHYFSSSKEKIFLPFTGRPGGATLAQGIRRRESIGASDKRRNGSEKNAPGPWHACIFLLYFTSREMKAPPGLGGVSFALLSVFTTVMTGVRVKVAHVFQGDKKNSEHVLLFRNFFAFTRAPGMTHNADDISSPLGDGQRG